MQKSLSPVLLIFGIIFLALGIGSIYNASEDTFTCTRVSGENGTCQYIEKTIINTKIRDFQLSNIQKAQLAEDYTYNNKYHTKNYTYQVRLCTDYGLIYILNARFHSELAEQKSYTNQINKFLTDTKQQSLTVGYGRSFADFFGAFCVIVGVGMSIGAVFTFLKG